MRFQKFKKHYSSFLKYFHLRKYHFLVYFPFNFNIKTVSCDEVRNIIKTLNSKKGALSESIPANVLKDYCEVYLPFLTKIINDCITNSIIPTEMKLAETIPVFKKIDPLDKKNYRPISLLSHLSKIIEKIIFNQISNFMEERFSNLLTGFRKNHNTQDSLIKMIESWKKLSTITKILV